MSVTRRAAACCSPAPPCRRCSSYVVVLIPFTPGIGDIRKARVDQPAQVLSADGKLLAEFKPSNREWVPLKQISPHMVDALIATEDHRFYEHHGLDWKRTASAALHTLGRPPGRLDDHAAARAQSVSGRDWACADAHAQGEGGDHRAEDRGGLQQGPDPRDLPEHGAVPVQRIRRRDGRAHLFRQVGQRNRRARQRDAGRDAEGQQLLQPGAEPGARCSGATRCSARW